MSYVQHQCAIATSQVCDELEKHFPVFDIMDAFGNFLPIVFDHNIMRGNVLEAFVDPHWGGQMGS